MPASIFSETLTQMIAEPVAATFRSIEQTRGALTRAMQLAAATSGHGTPDELPRPAGMPVLDVNEISRRIVIEKPRMLFIARQKSGGVERSTTTRAAIRSRAIRNF